MNIKTKENSHFKTYFIQYVRHTNETLNHIGLFILSPLLFILNIHIATFPPTFFVFTKPQTVAENLKIQYLTVHNK